LFGERLKMLREKAGVSQQKIADIVDLTQQAVGKWENNKAEPDLATVAKLAEFFNTTTDYLLGKTDDPHPPDPDIKDSPLAFYGNTNGINLEELEKVINRAVKQALDEREKKKKTGD
jgi:transcriptional regulator with XRE-family HTH domain